MRSAPAFTWFAFLIVLAGSPAHDARAASSAARADSLHHSAQRRLATGTADGRRIAIEELDQAVRLDPDDPDHQRALGRACLEAGSDHRARATFEKVLERWPGDADAHFGLALEWKRTWLAQFDAPALDSARAHAVAAVSARPDGCDERVLAALLSYESGDVVRARALVAEAFSSCPDRWEAGLMAAEFAWRAGNGAQANEWFTDWIPRLPPTLRARFEQTTPLLTEDDAFRIEGLSDSARAEALRRFWSQSDPDPTTDLNEARLEYWARVTHATLLFLDLGQPLWDIRAELYSRYGAPGGTRYEPMGHPLSRQARADMWVWYRGTWIRWGEPLWVPLHSMVLEYPQLGMRVLLHDQLRNSSFDVPRSQFGSNDPVPAPAALQQPDLVATPGARGVFPLHSPGVDVIPVNATLSDFADERGPRVLAQVEAPGSPDDSLWAEAVVLDSTERVIARASQLLSPSACDPAALRESGFDLPLQPGPYRVAIAVRGRDRSRGLARLFHDVRESIGRLSMSDLVMTCGSPAAMTTDQGIRLQPNLARDVAGEGPLVAYFEVYHLASDASGATRFEYRYTIRPENRAKRSWIRRLFDRGDEGTVVRSQSEGRDPTRRQFLVAPVRELSAGRYVLEVEVRDLVAGKHAVRTIGFVRS